MLPTQSEAYKLFHEGVLALGRAHEHGMQIDVEYCEKKKRQLTKRIKNYKEEFEASAFFAQWRQAYGAKTNIDSSTQLAHILYDILKIKAVKQTAGGRGSTDEDSLSRLNIPEVNILLKMKKLVKVRDTYLDAFLREQVDGVLHPFFNLHTTKTFRSCVAEGSNVFVPSFSLNPLSVYDTKKIEKIKKNDIVYCAVRDYEEANARYVCGKVVWAGKTGHKKVLELSFQNLHNLEIVKIKVTPEHRIMTIVNALTDEEPFTWKEAKDFIPGEDFVTGCFITEAKPPAVSCGFVGTTVGLEKSLYEVPYACIALHELDKVDVYDIEVEDIHNFIVEGIVVHNSSERINFQNIPKRDKDAMKATRRAIFPSKGNQLMESDFSSMEVRLSCAYNNDPVLKKYVTNPDSDMHGDMAEQIFFIKKLDTSIPGHKILRQAAKNGFIFPQFYGDYYVNCAENAGHKWGKLPKGRWKVTDGIELENGITLAEHLIDHGIKNYSDFEDHMKTIEKDFWGRRFRVYQEWKDKWWEDYQQKGYIDLLTGFRRTGIMTKNECINTPIQGTAFHCLLWSFIEIDRISQQEKWKTRLIGQIHDSMVFDVYPDELEHVKKVIYQVSCINIREHWKWINVPLNIDIELYPVNGPWDEKKGD